MQVIIYQTNAFTDIPFGGKSAGIVPDSSNLSDEDIAKILRAVDLEKMAFIYKIDEENFRVRFFKRKEEIKFCGYTTIASFFTMGQKGYLDGVENGIVRVYQHTAIGKNPIDIYFKNWDIVRVEMHKNSPTLLHIYENLELVKAMLNISEEDIGVGDIKLYPELIYSGRQDIIVPVKTREILQSVSPSYENIIELLKENGIAISEAPRVHVFTINDDESIECRQFEILAHEISERACSGTANVGMVFFLKRHSLISNREVLCLQGNFMDSPSKIYCEITDLEKEYPIKIGGMGNIFFEGIVKL